MRLIAALAAAWCRVAKQKLRGKQPPGNGTARATAQTGHHSGGGRAKRTGGLHCKTSWANQVRQAGRAKPTNRRTEKTRGTGRRADQRKNASTAANERTQVQTKFKKKQTNRDAPPEKRPCETNRGQIQIPDFDSRFRFQIQDSDFRFRLKMQISDSDFRFRFKIQISDSSFRFQIQTSLSDFRFKIQISDSRFRFQVQIADSELVVFVVLLFCCCWLFVVV